MKNGQYIESAAAALLGRAYEEETENLESQWRKVHLRILLIVSIIAVTTEFIMRFFISSSSIMNISLSAYIIKYLLIPVFSYAALNVLMFVLCLYSHLSEKALNYVISVGFAVFCLMMCFFHDYFVVIYASGVMAIALTAIYGDRTLTGITALITILSEIFILRFTHWDPDVVRDQTYMIDAVIIMLIEFCVYIICYAIVEWEDRRRHAVIMRQYEIDDLKKAVLVDPLTRLRNRQGLRQFIDSMSENASYVMLDIDYFKSVNDRWGHVVGDSVLCGMGGILLDKENEHTAAFRYGGDEFLIIYSGIENADIVKNCESIREAFLCILTPEMREQKVGLSYGISSKLAGQTPSEAIRRADEELYKNKSRR